ncbi:MAG: 3-dehydroquinate synthase [Bacteroidetes bacterium]|nr:3-dehydroquinate synthase [Bacteroidota bacterium]
MQKLISSTLSKVVIDKDLDDSIKELDNKVFIIDKNVYNLFKEKLDLLKQNSPFYLFEAEESKKTLSEVETIYGFFIKNIVTRNTVIVGIGGGIATDIAAFAASTFKRGCRLQLIPTTFLGMIDAAIGGKTAVNYNGIKNNIGTFYPAEKVIVDTRFLDSLSKKEIQNGWTECLKVALIENGELLEILLKEKNKITEEIITKAIKIKLSICEKDMDDKNERKLLNLGHTFGHVLESISDYQISHGEAVAIGIRVAAYISNKLGYLNKNDLEKINDLLNLYNLPTRISASYMNKMKKHGLNILLKDKKATFKLNVIFFEGFQKAFIKQVDEPKEIFDLFVQYLSKK